MVVVAFWFWATKCSAIGARVTVISSLSLWAKLDWQSIKGDSFDWVIYVFLTGYLNCLIGYRVTEWLDSWDLSFEESDVNYRF